MDEVHKWREEIYRETKKMALDEKMEYFHKGVDEICARYGLKQISFANKYLK